MTTVATPVATPTATPIDVPPAHPSAGARAEGDTKSATRTALADIAPFTAAIVPFGLAVGSAAAAAGLSLPELVVGGTILLAGAAQLAAIHSLGNGDGILVVALIVALVNLRFVIYGAGVASWFRPLPMRQRLALAFPIVDQTFLLGQQRFTADVDVAWRRRYYLVATAVLGGVFVGVQPVAFVLGTALPVGIGLHLAAPMTFCGMFARAVAGRAELVAGVVAGIAVVTFSGMLGPAALPVGVLLGAGVAAVVRRQP